MSWLVEISEERALSFYFIFSVKVYMYSFHSDYRCNCHYFLIYYTFTFPLSLNERAANRILTLFYFFVTGCISKNSLLFEFRNQSNKCAEKLQTRVIQQFLRGNITISLWNITVLGMTWYLSLVWFRSFFWKRYIIISCFTKREILFKNVK